MQCPHGMFTRRSDTEIRSGNENLAPLVFRLVEHEFRIATPRIEQRVVETGLLHALQEHGWNNLVSIDIGTAKRHGHAGKSSQFFHFTISFDVTIHRMPEIQDFSGFQAFSTIHRSAGDEMVPRMAVAAPDAYATPCPVDLRNCGSKWRWNVRGPPSCRGSYPGTWSSLRYAIRHRSP